MHKAFDIGKVSADITKLRLDSLTDLLCGRLL